MDESEDGVCSLYKMLSLIILCVVMVTLTETYQGSNVDPIFHIRKQGFDQDPKTFSHEIVAPWVRPFKPGYCDSWEWHTDERYREARLKICRELSGGKIFSYYYISSQ